MGFSYTIINLSGENRVSLPSSESEYIFLTENKSELLKFTSIENAFDVLVENYIELENYLLCYTMERAVRPWAEYSERQDDRFQANRHLLNLLSSAKHYLDFVNRISIQLSYCIPRFNELISLETHKQYDSKLGYRSMEMIRNHSQHFDLPISGLGSHGNLIDNEDGKLWRHRTIPVIWLESLNENDRIKPAILSELKRNGEYYPILPLIREYMSGLGGIHQIYRNICSERINCNCQVISDALDRVTRETGYKSKAFWLFKSDQSLQNRVKVEIFDGLAIRIQTLKSRNIIINQIESQFVSNQSGASDS